GTPQRAGDETPRTFSNTRADMPVDGDFPPRPSTSDCRGRQVAGGAGATKTATAATTPNTPVYTPPPMADNLPVYTKLNTNLGCDKKITFQPGIYPDWALLDDAFNCNKAVVYDFRPGVYYFNYTGVWNIDPGTVIGGTPAPIPT